MRALSMSTYTFLCGLFILFSVPNKSSAASGSVELDEFSFDKVINKFKASLVKFDVAYPYGDKHDAFVALAKTSQDVDELLVAEVGVKDYGEKENEGLAKKYGASKENFPLVKLFIKGQSEPVVFDDSRGFTSDELRRFVREKSGVYLSLPGCVKELDILAMKYMKTDRESRKDVLKEVEKILKTLADKEASSGKIYKTIMEKIQEKGDEFIISEKQRVNKLLGGKVSEEKKKELALRINILQTFQLRKDPIKKKEEL
ncbi:endoplasmic reticulum resident protein 29 [Epargyreus clarus]|uniref:endoplasmic reticulum resident protein 29 n=1 Tax=Epargyreus clarus TaxID=520877 RepID=UPI003C308FE7